MKIEKIIILIIFFVGLISSFYREHPRAMGIAAFSMITQDFFRETTLYGQKMPRFTSLTPCIFGSQRRSNPPTLPSRSTAKHGPSTCEVLPLQQEQVTGRCAKPKIGELKKSFLGKCVDGFVCLAFWKSLAGLILEFLAKRPKDYQVFFKIHKYDQICSICFDLGKFVFIVKELG